MQQPLGDLQDAFTELNINIPSTTEEQQQQEYLLPQWKDITAFLDKATEDFDVGQLVHLQSFTLFDAMSAIEIMDPRMDTGMLIEETTTNKFDIHKRLSADQTLGIMDRLVTREMAWISGHSLSQTVYTCIYFHHVKELNDMPMPTLTSNMSDILYGVLKSYVLATVKCCHYIWTEMTQGNVFEEEDFTTNLSGLSFNEQNPDVVVFNDIDSSIMLLNHLLNTNMSEEHTKIVRQILNRVEMRKSFLLSLVYFSQNEATHLTQARSELLKITELLKDVDLALGKDIAEAFDSNINRRLTSQTPPRPVELLSEKESFSNFTVLIQKLTSICTVVDFSSVTSLMNYFTNFGASLPYPDAFTRSKLNTLFFHNQKIFGTLSVSNLILGSVEETVRPPPWWLSPNQGFPSIFKEEEFLHAHETLKAYLNRISMVFVEYFKINCHNRSRQRRMLCKVVAEWEILQEEAAVVDEVFHALYGTEEVDTPYYFSSWAYNIKLSMIEKILFLGFELDLYGPHEYIMIYWYIQCVLGSRAYLLERIRNFMDTSSKAERAFNYLRTNQLLTHGKKTLSEGILKTLLSAKFTHQWDQKRLVFDSEETRYLHRFKPFIPLVSPAHPSYEMFKESLEIDDFNVDLIKAELESYSKGAKKSLEERVSERSHENLKRMKEVIKADLSEAKRMFEDVLTMSAEETNTEMCHTKFTEDIKNLIRTAIANNISLSCVKSKQEDPNPPAIEAVFKYHPWFPIFTKK